MVLRSKRSVVLLIIIFLVIGKPLISQDNSGSVYLTMENAIARALARNNQVKAAEFGIKKANWDKKNAWSRLMPFISLNSRFTRIDDRTFIERDFRRYMPPQIRDQIPQTFFQESYFTSVDVSMPLFNGALFNAISIANASQKMAEKTNESTRNNIIFLVVSNYLNVLKAIDLVNLQKEHLNLSELNYEKAERMYRAGRYSRTEALRWKIDYQQQKAQVVSSESSLRSAKTALARLVNADMTKLIQVDSRIPELLITESDKIAKLSDEEILRMIQIDTQQLIKANASLAAAKSNKEISKLFFRNSFSSYLPNVTFNYSHAWRENNTLALDDYSPKTVTVNLSLPLFTGFSNLSATKSAYYEYKQSQEQFSDQLQNTRFVLTETANKIINLKTQRSLSRTDVEYNENNYRVVEQQKEKGLVSNINFIDATVNLQNAKLNDVSNRYDFISAMVELYYLLGKLDSILAL